MQRAVRAEPRGLLEPRFEDPGSFHGPLTPPSPALTHFMRLTFEHWRGSLGKEEGPIPERQRGATWRHSRATTAIWDREQREKIYIFIETRRRMFVVVAQTRSEDTVVFSGATFGRFRWRHGDRRSVCSRQGRRRRRTRAAKHGCCLCFNCMETERERERLLTPQRTAALAAKYAI